MHIQAIGAKTPQDRYALPEHVLFVHKPARRLTLPAGLLHELFPRAAERKDPFTGVTYRFQGAYASRVGSGHPIGRC